MQFIRVIFTSFLFLSLLGCEQDNIKIPSDNFENFDINTRKGGCTVMSFCLQMQGMITSDHVSVENCVTERTNVLAVSTSAGDNDPMVADISLLQPDGCFGVITGIMGIHEERNSGLGRIEFYFTGSNGKSYVLLTRGVISGDDWLPTQSGEEAIVDFTNMEWEINSQGGGKGKKGNDECVVSGVFPQTPPTIVTVTNGACTL